MKTLIDSIKNKPLTIGIYARPGLGKTSLLLQMADMLTSESEKAFIISFEMLADHIKQRAERIGIDPRKFIVNDEYSSIVDAIKLPYLKDFILKQKNISMVGIDYVWGWPEDNLKVCFDKFTAQIDVPVIFTQQLSRAVEYNPCGRPVIDDIDKLCTPNTDIALSIWRPAKCYHKIDTADMPETEISILKSSVSKKQVIEAEFNEITLSFNFI